MSVPGSPDLGTVIPFPFGRVRRAFGGGPYVVEPSGCEVLTSSPGRLLWQLDLARALREQESRATFSCTVGAQYAEAEALATLRRTDPRATVAPCILTGWTFRVIPTPALATSSDLTAPIPLTSAGLGTGRLLAPLSIASGVLLERLLREGGSLWGIAEATLSGVSPRVPAVARFDPAVLLEDLLRDADTIGALPYERLVAAFRRDPADLPLELSGTVGASRLDDFAHTMADRIIARSGSWVPAQNPADAPVVRLTPSSPGTVTWSLSQPVLVQRRMLLRVDLLGAARRQAVECGLDTLVTRRNSASLPSLGDHRVTVLSPLPASRIGVEALGVALEFPPCLPARPQPRWATAVLEGDDAVEVPVRLSPGEQLRYRATPFALIADETGTRRLEGATTESTDPVLRLAPDDFPVELASCAVSPALAGQAVVTGVCSYQQQGEVHERWFTIDTGLLDMAIAVPRDRAWLRIDVAATARDGSGELSLGPFETAPIRLDLSSFPMYGPQQITLRCVFDDAASSRAVTLLPTGVPDAPETSTTVVLTPQEPVRTHRWFASSPFADGIRYRPYGGAGSWSRHRPADGELLLLSSQLGGQEARRVVAVRERRTARVASRPALRITEAVLAGREAAQLGSVTEAAVAPVATSPRIDPTDELIYARTDPPEAPGYVPRYGLDVQVSSGRQEYRIRMGTTASTSTLTVHLLATAPPSVLQQAPAATELPHTLGVDLEFLLAAGTTKTLPFTDVTRNGAVVTAVLTFATLAERDDVYFALTDPARRTRLVTQRFVDLLVPNPPVPPPPPPDLPITTGDPIILRPPIIRDPVLGIPITPSGSLRRPAFAWPPRRIPVLDSPPRLRPNPVQLPGISATRSLTGAPVTLAREHAVRTLRLRRRDPMEAEDDSGPLGPTRTERGIDTLPVPHVSAQGRTQESGFTRFRLGVDNWQEFDNSFFAASPDLPPCGLNTNASRTWVDILEAHSGTRLYGFCALGAAQNLATLWFAVADGVAPPAEVQVRLTDRRTSLVQVSNAVPLLVIQPPQVQPPPGRPAYLAVRQELLHVVVPEPFVFSPVLHGYIFRGLTPGGGGARLVRYTLVYRGRSHAYLQDASRPGVVYMFPDAYKIARRPEAPFTPFATVRVTSSADGRTTGVVFDYVIAPHVDQQRLVDARARLLADPRFGADSVEFQPFTTSDVSFTVDRPTESGSVHERRSDAAVVLQGALKDTLTMPLGDFRLLFDAMHGQTASLFLGHVDIATGDGDGDAEVIPFIARMDDLEGPVFQYVAKTAADGLLDIRLTNCIESALDLKALGVTVAHDDRVSRGLIRSGLPREGLRPGEGAAIRVEPESLISASASLELTFDLIGVTVHPDREAIWNSILDRAAVSYFRLVTVKVFRTVFDPEPGREAEQIRAVIVEFESGGTAELEPAGGSGTFVEATVRVDYPIDDVILHRPVASMYRYTRTVIRTNGKQRDPQPMTGTADVLYLDVSH